jgi:hypothetical protein
VRLQWWDAAADRWLDGPLMLSSTATHTHWFEAPIEASRFRLVSTGGASWPVGNVRLGELVFHGQALGAAHPDVIGKKAVAVLFDERESDLKTVVSPTFGGSFQRGDAFSGGTCIRVEAGKFIGAAYQPPFGHAIPNWDFEIVQAPQPGQYRWLQFACRALAPEARGASLRIGAEWPAPAVVVDLGEPFQLKEGVRARKQPGDKPAADWTVVQVDLWEATQADSRIRCLNLGAVGGPVAFGRVVLGRRQADLPAIK